MRDGKKGWIHGGSKNNDNHCHIMAASGCDRAQQHASTVQYVIGQLALNPQNENLVLKRGGGGSC